MAREYRMRKRADERDRTRERILQATMQLHDEQGVVPTTFADVARRAGVGQATVYRYFPTPGDLVTACGMHVWMEMRPPVPETAAELFAGLGDTRSRLERLVGELDEFYARGAHRLALASRDRALLPQLDGFLGAVEAGIEALVRAALSLAAPSQTTMRLVIALSSFAAWSQFEMIGVPRAELAALKVRLLECSLNAARGG